MAKEYTKERVLAFLNENEVSYDVQEHGAIHMMADVDSAGVQRKGIVLKNLFLKDGKGIWQKILHRIPIWEGTGNRWKKPVFITQ